MGSSVPRTLTEQLRAWTRSRVPSSRRVAEPDKHYNIAECRTLPSPRAPLGQIGYSYNVQVIASPADRVAGVDAGAEA